LVVQPAHHNVFTGAAGTVALLGGLARYREHRIEAGDVFLAAVNCSAAVRADLAGLGVDAAALCREVASVLPARRRGRRPRVMAFSQNVVTACGPPRPKHPAAR